MAENLKFKLLQKLLSTVANAVVFLDDGSAECLHWMNAVDKIFSAGALSIRSIDDSKVKIFQANDIMLDMSLRLSVFVFIGKKIREVIWSNFM